MTTSTRAHNFTLVKEQGRWVVIKYSFSEWTINEWTKLSTDCVHASSVNMVKNKMVKYLVRVGYSCGLYELMASLPTTSYSFAWASFLLFLYGSYFDMKCNNRQNDVPISGTKHKSCLAQWYIGFSIGIAICLLMFLNYSQVSLLALAPSHLSIKYIPSEGGKVVVRSHDGENLHHAHCSRISWIDQFP